MVAIITHARINTVQVSTVFKNNAIKREIENYFKCLELRINGNGFEGEKVLRTRN